MPPVTIRDCHLSSLSDRVFSHAIFILVYSTHVRLCSMFVRMFVCSMYVRMFVYVDKPRTFVLTDDPSVCRVCIKKLQRNFDVFFQD